MTVPALRDLLAALDRETHAARCRRIVDLARTHRESADLGRVLDGLVAESDYHALLAVTGAATAGDTARLRRLSAHPKPRIARAAARALPLPAATEDITTGYAAAAPTDRRLLRRRLAAERRTDIVDALIRLDLEDRERAGLLASASAEVAAGYLPDLADLVPSVRALATRHPGLVVAHLREATTAALPPVRDQWWRWAAPAMGPLVAHDPAAVTALLESNGPSGVLPHAVLDHLGALLRHDPHRVTALLTRAGNPPPQQLPSGLRRHVHLLSAHDRVRLARWLREREDLLAAFLDAMPPSERATVFEAAFAGIGTSQRVWRDELLAVLPRDLRHREARRIIGLGQVVTRDSVRLRHSAWLPPAEATEQVGDAVRAARAEDRAAAQVALLLSSARDRRPDALAGALSRLPLLRNEQDPVRLAVASALTQVSPRLLADVGLAELAGFARSVAAARDTSPATLHALQVTVWRIIEEALARGDADEAIVRQGLDIIDVLTEPRGRPWLPSFAGLPRGTERVIVTAFLPRLHTAAAKDDYHLLFDLAYALGERARGIPELDVLVQRALRAPGDATVRTAAQLWLADPRTRSARVEEALRIDESLAVLEVVQRTLSHSRQDLLEVLWKRGSLRGRLWGRKPGFVPLLDGPFGRWLPRQVAAYADALEAAIATKDTPSWTVTRAIRVLGRLPGIGLAYAGHHTASPHLERREAALAALAWTDRPGDALGRLLAIRTGDETRVAIYAAGRCLRNVTAARALPLLADALRDPAAKVTARKELVRLLGLIRTPAALDLLVYVGLDPQTHRDVRLAVGRTIRAWLDDERSWDVLDAVVGLGRDGLLSLLETEPTQLPVRHRRRYAALLLPGSTPVLPEAVAALGLWAPWLPEAMTMLAGLAADTSQPGGAVIVEALRQGLRRGADPAAVVEAVETLALLSTAADEPEVGPRLDLPTRQRLHEVALGVTAYPPAEQADHRDLTRVLAGTLAAHPSLREVTLTLAARAIDWRDPELDVDAVLALVDEPLRCATVRSVIGRCLADFGGEITDELGPTVDALLADQSLAAGAAALGIISWAGPRTGWTPLWQRRIRMLRRHPSPTIASWAGDVVTVRLP